MQVFGVERQLNWIKDLYDERDHIETPRRPFGVAKVDMRGHVAYVKDQGSAGSCTGHAGTELMELLYRTQFSQLGKRMDVNTLRFSPMYCYVQERIEEGTMNRDGGADSRTIMLVLAQKGCCLESDYPYDDKAVLQLPPAALVSEAAKYKIGAYKRVWDVDTARSVLQSSYALTVGMPVFGQMMGEEAAKTGYIRLPKPHESPVGGHEMLIVGCDDEVNIFGEIGGFIVLNSWSNAWGLGGFCYIPYSYFKAAPEFDFWTAHFGKPWMMEKTAIA